jgi:hypothetical protein
VVTAIAANVRMLKTYLTRVRNFMPLPWHALVFRKAPFYGYAVPIHARLLLDRKYPFGNVDARTCLSLQPGSGTEMTCD